MASGCHLWSMENVHYGDVLIKYGSVLDVQKDDIPRIPHRCREDFNGALLQDALSFGFELKD